jgi:hypothetical protein
MRSGDVHPASVLALAIVLAIPGFLFGGPMFGLGIAVVAALYLLWSIAEGVEDLREEIEALREGASADAPVRD